MNRYDMKYMSEKIKSALKKGNVNDLNRLILNLVKNPSHTDLRAVLKSIKSSPTELVKKIILNLIYVIGEIGRKTEVSSEIHEFLYSFYFKSDQWVRKEIIESIGKIALKQKLNEKSIDLLYISLKEEYPDLKLKSIEILTNHSQYQLIDNAYIFINLLDDKNPAVKEKALAILSNLIDNGNSIIQLINKSNLKLNKYQIRNLVVLFSHSIYDLYDLKNIIENSDLSEKLKVIFFSEINTIIKIMSK